MFDLMPLVLFLVLLPGALSLVWTPKQHWVPIAQLVWFLFFGTILLLHNFAGLALAVPLDRTITKPLELAVIVVMCVVVFGVGLTKFVTDYRRASASRRAPETGQTVT